jgi:hypothetical protein
MVTIKQVPLRQRIQDKMEKEFHPHKLMWQELNRDLGMLEEK